MAFAKQDKQLRPGYYNTTESSWGGLPIQASDGTWHLFHAQIANHCSLNEWGTNSIVARLFQRPIRCLAQDGKRGGGGLKLLPLRASQWALIQSLVTSQLEVFHNKAWLNGSMS